MELTFEPAQYAVIEAALELVRAQGGRRNRESLFVEIAQRILAKAEARTRRRHAVVVEKDAITGEVAYVTDRGYLPAQRRSDTGTMSAQRSKASRGSVGRQSMPLVAADATAEPGKRTAQQTAELATAEPSKQGAKPVEDTRDPVEQAAQPVAQETSADGARQDMQPEARAASAKPAKTANGRTPLPAAVERAVLERAGYACERCGRRQGLQIHHIDRVCRGSTHDPARLALLCKVCHASEHREEFDNDPSFAVGREFAMVGRTYRQCTSRRYS
jgi:hypothetical protein